MNNYIKSFISIIALLIGVYVIGISFEMLRTSDTLFNVLAMVQIAFTIIALLWGMLVLWGYNEEDEEDEDK